MMRNDLNETFVRGYNSSAAQEFLMSASRFFEPSDSRGAHESVSRIGTFNFDDGDKVPVFESNSEEVLSRSAKRDQYRLATKLASRGLIDGYSSALFFFSDDSGTFRLSLISATYEGTTRRWNSPRRQSFAYLPGRPNKTFRKRFRGAQIESVGDLAEIFSINQVTAEFYEEFEHEFEKFKSALKFTNLDLQEPKLTDITLLFVIRTIFLGFIQEKGWLGPDKRFLQESLRRFLDEQDGNYYSKFLRILFLESLNTPRGTSFSGRADLADETYLERGLTASPFLNGGLFRHKPGYDDLSVTFPNDAVANFFEFIFSFEFTVEENSARDEDLQLNPEFLGIIFERLINKEDGAVYTPRLEVELMANLSIVEWLDAEVKISRDTLIELVFDQYEAGEAPEISRADARAVLEKLREIRVLDPAVGSGAFLVGMLQRLISIEERLRPRAGFSEVQTSFERQREIIGSCLVGVEVREWAVWICQLRLWLSIFVDAPDNLKHSEVPILPALDFRVRTGDSLVQDIGLGEVKTQDTKISKRQSELIQDLARKKADFFVGKAELESADLHDLEIEIRREILNHQMSSTQAELDRSLATGTYRMESLIDDSAVSTADEQTRKVERLKDEISAIKRELENLDTLRGLVWEIEFADVFEEKNGFDIVIGNPPYIASGKIADPLKRLQPKEYRRQLELATKGKYPEFFIKERVALSGRSDLSSYFYALSMAVLNPRGVHVFICTNTWLDIESGMWLRKLLTEKHDLISIIHNSASKSFERADVNTIITVARAGPKPTRSSVNFITVKVPFAELNSSKVIAQHLRSSGATSTETFETIAASRSDETVEEKLQPEGSWGSSFLRSPRLWRSIVEKAGVRLTELEHVCEIAGYVHDNSTGPSYPLANFIKSLKDSTAPWLDEEAKGVQRYGVAESGQNRRPAQILIARTFGLDHRVLVNVGDVIGKEFYKVFTSPEMAISIGTFLNSTLGILQREILASAGLGGGAIKFAKDSVGKFLVPTHSIEFSRDLAKSFLKRPTLSISRELGFYSDTWEGQQDIEKVPADRLEIDTTIFKHLDVDIELLPNLYDVVAQLVRKRDEKASS